MQPDRSLRQTTTLLLFAALVACGDNNGTVDEPDGSPVDRPDDASTLTGGGLRVMTLNMYLGAGVSALFGTPSAQVPLAVAELWDAIRDSEVEQRVTQMATAITRLQPHVVALQEAVLVREQVPGDYLQDNPLQATEVVWDFLQLLLDALAAAGERYQVAVTQQNADIEAPRLEPELTLADARLTDRDVILVREGVTVSAPETVTFDAVLATDPITIQRGFVAIDAELEGTTYRIVNTHLEAADEGPEIRVPQAQQLVDALATEQRPLILLGDFNSKAPDGGAYELIAQAGYTDLWDRGSGNASGATCCQAVDLRGNSALARRIDIIFTRNLAPQQVEAVTALDSESERTASGLWPTDHAAVAMRIVP